MKLPRKDSGSVLMEFVIIAPMLLILIFGVVQFAYIFQAKQLTYYAAYSAARTALVYNNQDYSYLPDNPGQPINDFFQNRGPLYVAACTVMSWMNTGDGYTDMPFFPKSGADVWNQVRISGVENDSSVPSVNVTVHYFCPLFIPLIGDILAYALSGKNLASEWQVSGYTPSSGARFRTKIDKDSPAVIYHSGIPMIHLATSCSMAKPYSTCSYARIPDDDLSFFRLGGTQ